MTDTPPPPPAARRACAPCPSSPRSGTGGLLSLMVLCNAEVGRHGGPLAASLAPHATGLVAAALALALARAAGGRRGRPGGDRRRAGPTSAASRGR